MATFKLQVGTDFELDGVAYRIERIHQDEQVITQRLLDGKTVLKTPDELLAAYGAGRLRALQEDVKTQAPVVNVPLSALTTSQQRDFKLRRAYMQAIMDAGRVVYTPEQLKPLIAATADELGDKKPPSATTIWRWHSRFKAFCDARALVPRYPQRGSTLTRQSTKVLELLTDAVNAAFKASPKATVSNVHDRLAGLIAAENKRRLPDEQLFAPSKRTTYRLMERIEVYDQVVLREGQAEADRRFRMIKAGPRTNCILERVEADHTPLDLFLIDEVTWLPLGRPTLTVFLDHYSRFPLGYFLSYGGTSTMAVMGALRHSILPKEPATEVIPNLPVNHRWPCYGRMDVLVLDNGMEFHSHALESVALDLFIRLQFCPKRTPRFKGAIERYLKTVNYFFAHQLPGTSMAKLAERGDYDPQKHALLTLAEFKHVLEKWLLDVYAQTIHRGIGTTPWAKWQEGAQRRVQELPGDINTLKQRIGLVHERSLRADGITLDGIRYSDDRLLPILRKWGVGTQVRVVQDAEDLGDVQVWGPDEPDPVTVLAINQTYAKGLTLIQHKLIQQQARDAGKDAEDTDALIAAKHDIAIALETLMTSRKQRTRRMGAKGQGITSTTPHARLYKHVATSPDKATRPRKPAKPKPGVAVHQEDSPPPTLPSFQLKKGGA